MGKLLIVDDEELILKALQRELKNEGHDIQVYTDPRAALQYVEQTDVDLIISDYRMPRMNGVEFLTEARDLQPNSIRVIVSGNADLKFLQDAINKAEIYRFLAKPWDSYELSSTINKALDYHHLQQENKRLLDEIRNKDNVLKKQQDELKRLEELHPGLTKVEFDSDGAIVLEDTGS